MFKKFRKTEIQIKQEELFNLLRPIMDIKPVMKQIDPKTGRIILLVDKEELMERIVEILNSLNPDLYIDNKEG